jgi:hypothetical protein
LLHRESSVLAHSHTVFMVPYGTSTSRPDASYAWANARASLLSPAAAARSLAQATKVISGRSPVSALPAALARFWPRYRVRSPCG